MLTVIVGIVVLAGVIWFWMRADHSAPQTNGGGPPSQEVAPSTPAPPERTPAEIAAAEKDAELKQMLIGIWHHSESGDHWIENRVDGTARMFLKLDFVASLLYGQETAMELKWDVKDGVLTNRIESGSPQKNLESLATAFGKVRSYTFLEVTPERMLLQMTAKERKKDLWTRSPAPKQWAEQPASAKGQAAPTAP